MRGYEDENKIREIKIEKDKNGDYNKLRVVFGPHYFMELVKKGKNLMFVLGATHHGFQAKLQKLVASLRT